MSAFLLYVPRCYWSTVFRCAVGFAVIVLLCLFLPSEQPVNGSARSDKMLHKFGYHQAEVKVGYLQGGVRGEVEDPQQVLAPIGHRLGEGDLEMDEAGRNFTDEGMLKPDVSYVFDCNKLSSKWEWLVSNDYFTKQTLMIWFRRCLNILLQSN